MEWYTFGQMLMNIRLGQKAVTPDGRTVLRTAEGLYWLGGRMDGSAVVIKDYLFSDIWRIYEDEDSLKESGGREDRERKIREMIENQYEEERWKLLQASRAAAGGKTLCE